MRATKSIHRAQTRSGRCNLFGAQLNILKNGSQIKSQEPGIHLGVSKTSRTRLLLRCLECLSRKHDRNENGDKQAHKHGHKHGCSHIGLLQKVYT
jgi:hypothetical protein